MARIVFSDSGLSVYLPNPARDPEFERRGKEDSFGDQRTFQGRRPVIYQPENRAVFVGGEDWYHGDAYDHHREASGLQSRGDEVEGYFGGGPDWSDGELKWWNGVPDEDHQEVAHALKEAGFEVPNPESGRDEDDFDYEDPSLWD